MTEMFIFGWTIPLKKSKPELQPFDKPWSNTYIMIYLELSC